MHKLYNVDREREAGVVALRLRSGEDRGAQAVDVFIAYAQYAIKKKAQE